MSKRVFITNLGVQIEKNKRLFEVSNVPPSFKNRLIGFLRRDLPWFLVIGSSFFLTLVFIRGSR